MIARQFRSALLAAVAIAALSPAVALAGTPGVSPYGAGGVSGWGTPDQTVYDPATEYQQGLDDLQARKFHDAKVDFEHVMATLPKDADTLFYFGMAKAELGDLRGAQAAYAKSLAVEPDRIDARRELAVTLAKLGHDDEAKASLDILQKRADTCDGTCAQSADLKAAIAAVQAAMTPKSAANSQPPGPPAKVGG